MTDRISFGFHNPNHAATLACALLPLCWGWRRTAWLGRIVAATLFIAIVLTQSRMGLIVAVFECAAWWVMDNMRHRLIGSRKWQAPALILGREKCYNMRVGRQGCYVLRRKRGQIMATSSITANFSCSGTRAANTLVDLLLSETPPAKWTAPAPTGVTHSCATKREIRGAVQRIIRARRSMARA